MKRKRPSGTNRIPPFAGGESLGPGAWVISFFDVVQAERAYSVEQGVNKAEWLEANREPMVIKEREDGRRCLFIGYQPGARGWAERRTRVKRTLVEQSVLSI